mgnify:CR=1 FL=1
MAFEVEGCKVLIMRKSLVLLALMLMAASACKNSPESFVTGNLEIYEDFPSQFVESRAVRVWTPSDYDPSQKYDVIYMHDGQNLFDASITWNQQEWGVDEVISSLIESGEIRPCIVVGIDNSALRYAEYYPSAICDDVPAGVLPEGFRSWGDEYLRFVVEEVKPWVDGKYSTWTDSGHTFIMGSSCGGLISSYAFCRYPEVFGGAACLSTHSSLMNPDTEIDQKPASEAYIEYLKENLPADADHGDLQQSPHLVSAHRSGPDPSVPERKHRPHPRRASACFRETRRSGNHGRHHRLCRRLCNRGVNPGQPCPLQRHPL